jgi:hypothetical protein
MQIPATFAVEIFVLLDAPAPLAGMPFPAPETNWTGLHRLGFQRVLRLHAGAAYDPTPLLADEITLQDLDAGLTPREPSLERARIVLAGQLVAQLLQRGEGVIVHCLGGTGRTGTVLASALCQLGHTPDEAVTAIKAHRPQWPESPWHEELVRTF